MATNNVLIDMSIFQQKFCRKRKESSAREVWNIHKAKKKESEQGNRNGMISASKLGLWTILINSWFAFNFDTYLFYALMGTWLARKHNEIRTNLLTCRSQLHSHVSHTHAPNTDRDMYASNCVCVFVYVRTIHCSFSDIFIIISIKPKIQRSSEL